MAESRRGISQDSHLLEFKNEIEKKKKVCLPNAQSLTLVQIHQALNR